MIKSRYFIVCQLSVKNESIVNDSISIVKISFKSFSSQTKPLGRSGKGSFSYIRIYFCVINEKANRVSRGIETHYNKIPISSRHNSNMRSRSNTSGSSYLHFHRIVTPLDESSVNTRTITLAHHCLKIIYRLRFIPATPRLVTGNFKIWGRSVSDSYII